jgi:hypothetical protein
MVLYVRSVNRKYKLILEIWKYATILNPEIEDTEFYLMKTSIKFGHGRAPVNNITHEPLLSS